MQRVLEANLSQPVVGESSNILKQLRKRWHQKLKSAVYRPQVNNAWGLIGGFGLAVLIVAALWLELSRYVLTRFVKDLLKDDSGMAGKSAD